MKNRKITIVALLAITMLLLPASQAGACNVPVFRYALENWIADPYRLIILHDGKLTADQKKTIESIKKHPAIVDPYTSSVLFGVFDTSGEVPKEIKKILEKEKPKTFPRMLLMYPQGRTFPEDISSVPIWSGELSKAAADKILNSPARKKISNRILANQCAVWMIIESGDKKKDLAAEKLLKETLEEVSKEISLPDEYEGVNDEPRDDLKKLSVQFSILKISRSDPAEKMFLDMILKLDKELSESDEPIIVPFIGRGRAVTAMWNEGINADGIIDLCYFVTGACSCQVKAQNPGFDMLFSVNWDELIDMEVVPEKISPELTGMTTIAPASQPTSQPTSAPAKEITNQPSNTVLRNTIFVVCVCLAVVAMIVLILHRRGKKGENN